jgi:hypothetical protein
VAGHYDNYLTAMADSDNDLASVADEAVGPESEDEAPFGVRIQGELDAARMRINNATATETAKTCFGMMEYDTACQYRGRINFFPFVQCP